MKVYLAQNIKYLRKKMSKSQDQLAQSLNISRNKVATYENGISEPRLDLLPKCSELFKVTIDDLLVKEIDNNNYDDCIDNYLINKQRALEGEHPDISVNIDNKDALSIFAEKTINLEKMIHGFKAYHEIKTTYSAQNSDIQSLLSILEHLLSTNQSLISELKPINSQ